MESVSLLFTTEKRHYPALQEGGGMKILKIPSVLILLWLNVPMLHAQSTPDDLQRQMKEMSDKFEKIIREQRDEIDALKKRVDSLQTTLANNQQNVGTNSQTAATTNQPPGNSERDKLTQQLAVELGQQNSPSNAPPSAQVPAPTGGFSPTAPITVARAGSSYMNISFDTLMDVGGSSARDPSAQLQLGDHDPIKRGFSLRNAEIAVDGAVDPYFKGFGNIVLKLDRNNETEIELEEAYLTSTSLPANLQVKAGQFFSAFGRQNAQHPHTWAFVDAPIILTRAFGPDGLRSIGAQVSWLAPTPFYTEAFLGIMDGEGSTSFSFRNPGDMDTTGISRFRGRATQPRVLEGPQDLVLVPRIASSFELTDQQTLVVGASGAFGPNDTGPHSRTEVYGVDSYWKWKAPNANEGFPFVPWQTEALYMRYGANADPTATPLPLPAENLRDWGMYSQVLWGFKPRWVVGLRGEYADGTRGAFDASDVFRGERTRISPDLTFYPSEFSKIRLQYNYDHGALFGNQHSIWLQVEFLLGAHGAHKF